MSVTLRIEVADPVLVVGLVEVHGATIGPSPEALAAALDAAVAAHAVDASVAAHAVDASVAAHAAGKGPSEAVRAGIRELLRRGHYKPSGRGKPSSEFLGQAAAKGEFPRISNAVDAISLVSLETGIPMSVVDLDRALGGAAGLVLRYGRADEKYVFNAAGHVIALEDILCVARDGGAALANAVKDSMESKVAPETTRLLAVLYGSREVVPPPRMREVAERVAGLLKSACGAASAEVRVLPEA